MTRMRFLIDESAELSLAAFLRERGYDTTTVVRDYVRSLRDREILEIARREKRIIITNDKDFGELVYRSLLQHHGVILFRMGDESLQLKLALLDRLLIEFSDRLEASFVVVTENKLRFRR
jgi:predicted nuclease of predicted toxin-antitoxin system